MGRGWETSWEGEGGHATPALSSGRKALLAYAGCYPPTRMIGKATLQQDKVKDKSSYLAGDIYSCHLVPSFE